MLFCVKHLLIICSHFVLLIKSGSVEEQVDVPRFFLLDDIADVVDLPIYDEYDDDYDFDFLEQPVACSLSENVPF
jgi:hypothetical protein